METLLTTTALVAGFMGLAEPAVPLNWQAPAPLEMVLTEDDQPPATVRNASGGAAWVLCPGFINPKRPDIDITVAPGTAPTLTAEAADQSGPAVASLIVYDSRGAWHCLHADQSQVSETLPEQPGGVLNVWIGMAVPTQYAMVSVSASDWSGEIDGAEGFYGGESFAFTTPWGTTSLVVDDNGAASGSYERNGGRLLGALQDDGSVAGQWSQAPTYKGKNAGEFEFVLTEDGCALDGRWRYTNETAWHEDWDGARIGGGC
jgi:hypothetical protein